jgi:hypothetical protein
MKHTNAQHKFVPFSTAVCKICIKKARRGGTIYLLPGFQAEADGSRCDHRKAHNMNYDNYINRYNKKNNIPLKDYNDIIKNYENYDEKFAKDIKEIYKELLKNDYPSISYTKERKAKDRY